ncbi:MULTISPECIES: hypothetical protein [unclassified Aquimarina]|uniref:hypothetical protein n=1 Tax=unclassified Aquimarina TaxID=2627091 RepID=UPI0020B41141
MNGVIGTILEVVEVTEIVLPVATPFTYNSTVPVAAVRLEKDSLVATDSYPTTTPD